MNTNPDLEVLADQIPSMGGATIGAFLRLLARQAAAGSAIVEVGTWLGSGTARLALGVRDRGPEASLDIHCYDAWLATRDEAAEARTQTGIVLGPHEDTLPR